MGAVRLRLRVLSALWLSFQVAGLSAAPLAVHFAGTAAVEDVCTCPGGDHQTCPMHHGQPRGSDPNDASRCALRSACAPADAALLPLAGGLGVLPGPTMIAVRPAAEAIIRPAVRSQSHLDLPEAPPPRA
jgi:hypothetical protein